MYSSNILFINQILLFMEKFVQLNSSRFSPTITTSKQKTLEVIADKIIITQWLLKFYNKKTLENISVKYKTSLHYFHILLKVSPYEKNTYFFI